MIAQLQAVDVDDAQLEFRIQGEVANEQFELSSTGPMSADVKLKSPLDREVSHVVRSRSTRFLDEKDKKSGQKMRMCSEFQRGGTMPEERPH